MPGQTDRENGRNSHVAAILVEGLAELGRDCSDAQLAALIDLALLLEVWSARINLTGHRDARAIAKRLILDAIALVGELPSFQSLADLGSGAGFPGLPIAILYPERTIVLVEARERRHFFQREAVRRLGLENVTPLRGRIEELEPRCVDTVVAQAVAPPERVLEWMLAWALPRAFLVIPGGETAPEPGTLGVRRARVRAYQVPLGGPKRTLWIGERSSR